MKRTVISVFTTVFAFTVLSSSCQDENILTKSLDQDTDISETAKNNFKINDGVIVSPEWLVQSVDSIAKSHNPGEGGYIYPFLYKVYHNGEDYYLIIDAVKSTNDHAVFTLNGMHLGIKEAREIIEEKNKELLWHK